MEKHSSFGRGSSSTRPAQPDSSGTTGSSSFRHRSERTSTLSSSLTSSSSDNATDKVRRGWRNLASTIVTAMRAAEKQVVELDEAVSKVFTVRAEFRGHADQLEGKLTGRAKETEALEGLLRSQPCLGRKRKRLSERQDSGSNKKKSRE